MLCCYARISEKSETNVRIGACRTKENRNRTATSPVRYAFAAPAGLVSAHRAGAREAQVSDVSTSRRGASRYSLDCISTMRETVRLNSPAIGPSG